MLTRLHSKFPVLADAVLRAPKDKLRNVMDAAAKHAASESALDTVLLQQIEESFEQRDRGAVVGIEDFQKRQEEEDERYLSFLDGLAETDELPTEGVDCFRRARALAAVCGALSPAEAVAASEVVYESLAACSDEPRFVAQLSKLLHG